MRVPQLLMICTLCLTGCVDYDTADTPFPSAALGLSLQDRINDAVSRITADTCFAQSDTSNCNWADYEVGPNHFDMAVSTNESILVIDDFPEGTYPQLVRYRNRILGFYQATGDNLQSRNLSVRLPRQLGDSLISFADPDFIPAVLLAPVASAVSAAYSRVPLLFTGHGGIVLSHLIELAPEQPIVLLNISGLLGLLPSLCTSQSSQTLATARAHFAALASSLRQVITLNNVKFINASFGDTAQTIATDWSRTCGTTVPNATVVRELLHLYDPIYDALFNTQGVIAAHAAADLGTAADFPFDQVSARYPNQVRVGFISSLSSGLDELGRGTVQKSAQLPNSNSDADVFVNWGCVTFVGCADSHYEMAGDFGLSSFAVPLMSTSYVDPLGLGRLINLRYANHDGAAMNNTLIQTLKRELTPRVCGDGSQRCIYQDPIAHRQLEVYRQHYR